MAFKTVLNAQAALGECPLWSVREKVFWWVDIAKPSLNRFDPETGENTLISRDENTGCIGLRNGGGFIAGLRSGLWLLGKDGSKQELIANPQENIAISRFNDGRVHPWGHFWAGTIHEPRDQPAAAFYRVDTDLSCHGVAGDIKVLNGVAFAPDRRTVDHSDTLVHVIYRFPLDPATGEIGERSVFCRFPDDGEGRPDGAPVDLEGCYWSALYEGGRVVRILPESELLEEYLAPARRPSMCALGGSDLKTLYVTSARRWRSPEELAEWPEAGDIFAMRTDLAGQPEPQFAG